ncbi:MAG: hypothetical protein QGI78_00665 [Phycisphaerales bacterium]|nr:hypothetical protein [Phycisphaerales bacterium]
MVFQQFRFDQNITFSPKAVAIAVFGTVLLLPILLLLFIAGTIAFLAFAILTAVTWVVSFFRGSATIDTSGRKNVRIRERPDENE